MSLKLVCRSDFSFRNKDTIWIFAYVWFTFHWDNCSFWKHSVDWQQTVTLKALLETNDFHACMVATVKWFTGVSPVPAPWTESCHWGSLWQLFSHYLTSVNHLLEFVCFSYILYPFIVSQCLQLKRHTTLSNSMTAYDFRWLTWDCYFLPFLLFPFWTDMNTENVSCFAV